MPVATIEDFVKLLRSHRLLESAQLEEVERTLIARFPEPQALARQLVTRGWLTPYQANQLFQVRGVELLLGSYVILELLGEGGMGQVFKARNWKLSKVVALKVIRKERLTNPLAIRRFHREIQAAAQLNHPNVVRAFDADQVSDTHFLVMECVEGIDLAKLVKKHGPLPVAQACDCAHQAALGLQHAYERGLVHRDIKPQNLLLTQEGVVKVLDMGLARLDQPAEDTERSSTMTQEGTVMGSLDYIAPEQALNSHTVDTRADLYSLGCTLYYLLTGRVPFPASSATEKLLKHQMEGARPVEELRPEVPPAVAAVVSRLMAKRPDDRYQIPAEAAAALAMAVTGPVYSAGPPLTPGDQKTRDTDDGWRSLEKPLTASDSASPLLRRRAARRRRRWFKVGGVLVLGLLGLGLYQVRAHILSWFRPAPVVEPPQVSGLNLWIDDVARRPPEKQVQAVATMLKELNPGFDGTVAHTIDKGMVIRLEFLCDKLTDIRPLRALTGLVELGCYGSGPGKGQVTDLSALQGIRLTTLNINNTQFADLSSLRGFPLTSLSCVGTKVIDLSPLKGMKLTSLSLFDTQVSDLTPLKGMPLTILNCKKTAVVDLTPLKGMKLIELDCQDTSVASLAGLQDMPLTSLNCSSSNIKDLAPLKGTRLTWLNLHHTQVADLTPLQGLPLTTLICNNTSVVDLSPLRGMKLTSLNCSATQVADLTPLVGMSLTNLVCDSTKVSSLGPLAGVKLSQLVCSGTPVTDLSPLKEMPLIHLTCNSTKIMDLSPLKGMQLIHLHCEDTFVADLSPLRDMQLNQLYCNNTRVADLAPLKNMNLDQLRIANTQVSDLSPLKDMSLTNLDCSNTKIMDLAPLQGMKLTSLYCSGTRVADLTPLKELPLKNLYLDGTKVVDLTPLQEMKLTVLSCKETQVADLAPLKNLPLSYLQCDDTKIKDLTPLQGKQLTHLQCRRTLVADLSPLRGMPLQILWCDFQPARDTEILRSIKTLTQINGKPANQFWDEVGALQAKP